MAPKRLIFIGFPLNVSETGDLTQLELCPTCGSALDGKKFLLEIKYPDHPDSVRVELEDTDDLMVMELFLQGKDRYGAWNDRESALKNRVDRLRELFGVKE